MGSSFGGHEVHVDWLGRRLAHLPRRTRRRIAWTREGREHRRRRGKDGSRWWDVIDVPFYVDSVTVMLALLAAVVVLVVLSYLGVFALLFALAELVLLVPLLVGAFAARLLLRRPWRVTVHRAPLDAVVVAADVRGYRAARRLRDRWRRELTAGVPAARLEVHPGDGATPRPDVTSPGAAGGPPRSPLVV